MEWPSRRGFLRAGHGQASGGDLVSGQGEGPGAEEGGEVRMQVSDVFHLF